MPESSAIATLIIEDSFEYAEMVSGFLERLTEPCMECVVAGCLSDALAVLETQSFGLILIDLNLPDSGGIETFRHIHGVAPVAAIVILSGMEDEALALEIVAAGAQEYLGKEEVNERTLRRTVRYALERARAEAVRREHALLMETTQRVGRMGVWQRDLRTGALSWPAQTCELFGVDKERFGGTVRDFIDRVHPDDRSVVIAAAARSASEGASADLEYRVVRPDGEIRWMHERGNVDNDVCGRPARVLGVVIDITERKSMEQQLLRTQRMDSIGTLAGGIAHDLNNIFSPIIMAMDLLQRRMGESTPDDLLDTIRHSARRGAEMVSQILSFARGMEGRQVEVQVSHLVRDIRKIIAETFPKNIAVKVSTANELPTFTGDPTQIHQILMNLCVNAKDAMRGGGGELNIAADEFKVDAQYAASRHGAKPGRYVRISVRDSGAGIHAKDMEKLFDPFFTTKEAGKGTGLGLSTVMKIVQSHEGFVEVESAEGRGSRFTVCFLAVRHRRSREHGRTADVPAPRGDGELVLVVDDELSVLQITKQTLESSGYQVITAGDGAEGVVKFTDHSGEIRAVLSDMMMPVMDGLALLRVIRRMNASVPFIVASGGVEEDRAERLHDEGVSEYLPKPFTAETVLRALGKALGKAADPVGA